MIRWLVVLFTLSTLADVVAGGYDDYLEEHPDASRLDYRRALQRAQEEEEGIAAPSSSGSFTTILNPATGDLYSVYRSPNGRTTSVLDLKRGTLTPILVTPR